MLNARRAAKQKGKEGSILRYQTGRQFEESCPYCSSMAAPIGVEDFAEDLSCSICLELFSDPVILECGHNFCQACITRYWEELSANGGDDVPLPTCPECRHEIPGGKFTANRLLGQLAQKALESLSAHASDEDVELDENDEEVQGDRIFCVEDGCLARALQPEHWGHQCLPLEEAVEHYKVSRGRTGPGG